MCLLLLTDSVPLFSMTKKVLIEIYVNPINDSSEDFDVIK